ncbi:MAG: hypothetical protein [Wendovervirus sonii]|uniref:DUF1566 domain-containing protein n=1 Tax=phage Lak_Megaphage_Sonny TaxID=3109229 RepID=A0ABZ0Z407_9CAUD|nr:MAG: hypothetical protein [phage Lak_Megaphage_Sonny]
MKILYKKIYEAINTGIQKALVLDDEDDVSIIYQHKKIVNNANLMSYYVNELLQDSNIEYNYEQIIKYYTETEYTYKIKDFDELKNIFDKIKDIKNISWKWIDIKDYVSVILEDDTEINFYEETDKKLLFLKFANDNIVNTGNEILIYLYNNYYMPKKEYWQTKSVQIQNNEYLINIKKYGTWEKAKEMANNDYAGYENCLRIQSIVQKDPEKYDVIPAIDYCLNLNINGYQGYLPSMGQLRIMIDNIDLINYIFKYLNLNELNELSKGHWWSSTEYDTYNSWNLRTDRTYTNAKVNGYSRIFPLFALKKN